MYVLNSLTITSGEIQCRGLESLTQDFYIEPLYFPDGVRIWSPNKSHLEYDCFKYSLKTMFTRMYTCDSSNEFQPCGHTWSSRWIETQVHILIVIYTVIYESMYRAQFSNLKMSVKLYRMMMALYAETCSAMSYYKTNKLIITQWNVNEIAIVVVLRQEPNKKAYLFCLLLLLLLTVITYLF
jgi:hypothetical protein